MTTVLPETGLVARNLVTRLEHFGVITVTGEDAEKFLAGQFTSDVAALSDPGIQFSAWCDAKGRVLATFLLIRQGHTFYLLLPRDMTESTLKRLRMFVLRAKLSIDDQHDSTIAIGVAGTGAGKVLATTLGIELPRLQSGVYTYDDCLLACIAGVQAQRWLLLGPANRIANVLAELAAGGLEEGTPDDWQTLDVLAGLPFISGVSVGEYLPQMLNLESLGGLSYSKGCYPGQEVIARLHYRGQLKRQLMVGLAAMPEAPLAGTAVFTETGNESIGRVVMAGRLDEGHSAIGAVIDLVASDTPLHVGGDDGPVLSRLQAEASMQSPAA